MSGTGQHGGMSVVKKRFFLFSFQAQQTLDIENHCTPQADFIHTLSPSDQTLFTLVLALWIVFTVFTTAPDATTII